MITLGLILNDFQTYSKKRTGLYNEMKLEAVLSLLIVLVIIQLIQLIFAIK